MSAGGGGSTPVPRRSRALTRVGLALVVALLPLVTAVGEATADPAAAPAAHPQATTTGVDLVLTEVTPAVAGPEVPVTIAGTVRATGGAAAPRAVRVLRARTSLASRSEVDAWATATTTPTGTELGRTAIGSAAPTTPDAPAGPDTPVPFRITLTPESLRVSAAVGAVPIAVEVLGAGDARLGWVRTFVGWARSVDSPRLSLGLLVPLTVDPDAALAAGTDTRTAAWLTQLGPTSRLARLLGATANATVGYAVDPALVSATAAPATATGPTATGPVTGSTGEPTTLAAAREALAQTLTAAAASHPILALPRGDADLSGLLSLAAGGEATPPDVARAVAGLTRDLVVADGLSAHGIPVAGRLAWPADGPLTAEEERALRAAYGSDLPSILLAGSDAGAGRLTSPAPATTSAGTPVLRHDDRLDALFAAAGRPESGPLTTQEFVAQTAALYAERPSIARSFLAVAPAGFDPAPESLARFLGQASQLPWLQVVPMSSLLSARTGGGTDGLTGAENVTTPAGTSHAPSRAREPLATVGRGRELVDTFAEVLPATSTRLGTWSSQAELACGLRWRDTPARQSVLDLLAETTDALVGTLSIAPQTTNFLADEGLLQVTVVNDLDEPVTGVRVVLVPGNGRLRVIEPPAPVSVGAHSRAIVAVRMAAAAQGLVPVTAWLTTPLGLPVGAPQELSVRAAPPGAWLYVALGGLTGVVLLVGIVRALRRPRTRALGVELDPVLPTPEVQLEDPIDTP